MEISKTMLFVNGLMSVESKECIPWPYAHNTHGRPAMWHGQRVQLAARVICELYRGPSDGNDAAHDCGNKACVNPRHIVWKTRRENLHDRVRHGTDNAGERCGNAKLTADQASQISRLKGILPQAAVALKFGIAQSTVSQIQNGSRWARRLAALTAPTPPPDQAGTFPGDR